MYIYIYIYIYIYTYIYIYIGMQGSGGFVPNPRKPPPCGRPAAAITIINNPEFQALGRRTARPEAETKGGCGGQRPPPPKNSSARAAHGEAGGRDKGGVRGAAPPATQEFPPASGRPK